MTDEKKQELIERRIYNYLDELSYELDLDLSCYPEVCWMGKKFDPASLCLPKYLEEETRERQHFGISFYLVSKSMIMVGRKSTQHALREEASRAFHFIVSGLSLAQKSYKEKMILSSIVEMLGFLGARMLGSQWENLYKKFPDLMKMTKQNQQRAINEFQCIFGDGRDFEDFFVHQQGYGLADGIYCKYLSGEIEISDIRKLFLKRFDLSEDVIAEFVKLKNRFWFQN